MDIALPEKLRLDVEAEFSRLYDSKHAAAVAQMVAAFGADWQAQGGLTDAEIA